MKSLFTLALGLAAFALVSIGASIKAFASPLLHVTSIEFVETAAVPAAFFVLLVAVPAVAVAARHYLQKIRAAIGTVIGFLLFSTIAARAHPHRGAELEPDLAGVLIVAAGIVGIVLFSALRGRGSGG